MPAVFDAAWRQRALEGDAESVRLLIVNGLPVEPVVAWLHENGGYCDCEALANAEEAWRGAIGE